MISFLFKKIEFDCECDPDPQLSGSVFESMLTLVSLPNLNPISKPTLIPIPIELEHESLIFYSHILLLENECELEFYDLDQTHELTLTLKPKLDLSFILESVSVPIPFIIEPKLFIP